MFLHIFLIFLRIHSYSPHIFSCSFISSCFFILTCFTSPPNPGPHPEIENFRGLPEPRPPDHVTFEGTWKNSELSPSAKAYETFFCSHWLARNMKEYECNFFTESVNARLKHFRRQIFFQCYFFTESVNAVQTVDELCLRWTIPVNSWDKFSFGEKSVGETSWNQIFVHSRNFQHLPTLKILPTAVERFAMDFRVFVFWLQKRS